jgi:hypothetical protein
LLCLAAKMSLANKLSIENVDLKGKRVLIRVCLELRTLCS